MHSSGRNAASETTRLSDDELVRLVERVFAPTADDRRLLVVADLPDDALADNPDWAARRAMALDWATRFDRARSRLGLDVSLVLYRNVRANNADLPATATRWPIDRPLPHHADELGEFVSLDGLFSERPLVLALTELSATAPLKVAARQYGLRAATMPGFKASMIPALRLDYTEIDRQVRVLAALLDRASQATLDFAVGGHRDRLVLDLRHRRGHASGGLVTAPGTAGNLPSGEAYIVPYEGELDGEPSGSEGWLPVQFDDEVVRFEVRGNVAIAVEGDGPQATSQRDWLANEPAYGNLAELGLGVLADFGVEPIGETLLDEKLGLHVAFGRSDHFGGQVGPAQFSRPEAVVHIDRVYLPETQPRIDVLAVDLVIDGETRPLMRAGRYVVDL